MTPSVMGEDIYILRCDDSNVLRHGIFQTLANVWYDDYNHRKVNKSEWTYDIVVKDILGIIMSGFNCLHQKYLIAHDAVIKNDVSSETVSKHVGKSLDDDNKKKKEQDKDDKPKANEDKDEAKEDKRDEKQKC